MWMNSWIERHMRGISSIKLITRSRNGPKKQYYEHHNADPAPLISVLLPLLSALELMKAMLPIDIELTGAIVLSMVV